MNKVNENPCNHPLHLGGGYIKPEDSDQMAKKEKSERKKIVQSINNHAENRAKRIAEGQETRRFASLMIKKYGQGMIEAAAILIGSHRYTFEIKRATEKKLALINPDWKAHEMQRRNGSQVDVVTQPTKTKRYTFNEKGCEVTDTETALTWKRCPEGMIWDGDTCSGTATEFTWEEAKEYTSIQRGDWRMPINDELLNLWINGAFGTNVFPYNGWIWAPWQSTHYSDLAYCLNPHSGIDTKMKLERLSVLLVRDKGIVP